MLIDRGASIDLQTKNGWTALALANEHGHEMLASLLRARGAWDGRQDKTGWTAPMMAKRVAPSSPSTRVHPL